MTLEIKVLLAPCGIHELMYQWNSRLAAEVKRDGLVQIPASSRTPEVFLRHDGEFRSEPHWYLNTIYRRENERGYSGLEDLWKPGSFRWTLAPGQTVHLACSMEPLELKCKSAPTWSGPGKISIGTRPSYGPRWMRNWKHCSRRPMRLWSVRLPIPRPGRRPSKIPSRVSFRSIRLDRFFLHFRRQKANRQFAHRP